MTDASGSSKPELDRRISELLDMLTSDSLPERLTAIQVRGEIGDLAALQRLRERPTLVNGELQALIVAVGRLQSCLRVK
jgi:hypothetical protein